MLEQIHPTPWSVEGDEYSWTVRDARDKLIFGYSSNEGELSGTDREDFLDEMVARVNESGK